MYRDRVTAEEIKAAVEKHGIVEWQLRRCSICNTPLAYFFESGRVLFDPSCDCTPRSRNALPVYGSWEELADLFNVQTPVHREKLWESFINAGE